MLKQQARALATGVFVLALTLVAGAFFLAHWLRTAVLPSLFPDSVPPAFYPLEAYLPLLPLVLGIWGVLLLVTGRYRSHRTVPLGAEARGVIKVCLGGMALLALMVFSFRLDRIVLENDQISRLWIALVGAFACVLLLSEKIALRTVSRWIRSKGYNYRNLLIVGTHPGAIALADSIRDHRYWGYRILGLIAHPGADTADVPERYKVLGTIDGIMPIVHGEAVDDVLFCVGRRDLNRLEDLFLALSEQGICTRFALNLFPHARVPARLEDLDGTPVLTFSTLPEGWFPMAAKRASDVVIGAVLLMLTLPIVLAIGLAIKLTSGGRVVYRQTRCGLNGRRFTLYKFRTMVEDAEERKRDLMHLNEMNGPVFKVSKDPRVTKLGRILRRFSLDELPQLWNVVRGDMSLVGPRPPIPEEVAQYQRWQRRRLSMKPGLTCLWQISGRNQVDFDRWIELDLEYIDSWSPWLDFKILAKTVPAVLSGRGAS